MGSGIRSPEKRLGGTAKKKKHAIISVPLFFVITKKMYTKKKHTHTHLQITQNIFLFWFLKKKKN